MYSYFQTETGVRRADGLEIPEDINDENWQQFLDFALSWGLLTPEERATNTTPQPDDRNYFAMIVFTLDQIKENGKLQIDNVAGNARTRYITSAPGQEMTYLEKSEEAADYAAAGYPADTTNYPFVAADATAYSITPQQAADQILAQRAVWITAGAQIEQVRLNGKNQVNTATTQQDVQLIVETTISALNAI